MTKAEIVRNISSEIGVDGMTALKVVDTLVEQIRTAVSGGEEVFLRGFGTFGVKHRAAKKARNISKGTEVVVPEHDVPVFKPCNSFKQQVLKK